MTNEDKALFDAADEATLRGLLQQRGVFVSPDIAKDALLPMFGLGFSFNERRTLENWHCPICGHDKYQEADTDDVLFEIQTTDDGHVCDTKDGPLCVGYECCGCTVMFGTPARFNKAAITK